MVTQHKSRMLLYAASATLGSVVGCLVLYYLGRKGGEALVRKRFSADRIERALATLPRYGVMAVLIPSLLPPPTPFKIFILLAGVAGISAPGSPSPSRSAAGSATSPRRCSRSSTATRRWSIRETRTAVSSRSAVASLVRPACGGYLLWAKDPSGQSRL